MCLVQENKTPFQIAVNEQESEVVSLFVNKYKVDPKQYDQVTKVATYVHNHMPSYLTPRAKCCNYLILTYCCNYIHSYIV